MSTSRTELSEAVAQSVSVSEDALLVDLVDGRTITVPVAWFPRLAHGTPAERANWRLIGSGEGIHWPDLDEDISVESLLAGRRSGETQASLRRWLQGRFGRAAERPIESLSDTEAEQIRKALAATGGNKSRAAQILGIERKTLYRKLERMKL